MKLRILLLALALSLFIPTIAQAATYETRVEYGVNFRASPSTNAYIYRMIPTGEHIHVMEKVNSYWLKVKVQDGTIGYISADSKYTSSGGSTGNGTIVKGVNFRSSPSVNGSQIGFIAKGTTVKVLEVTNQWWVRVQHNGKTGYVSSDYISHSSSGSGGGQNGGSSGAKADRIIDHARSLMGRVTYQFGVRNVSRLIFDCSSFTQYVFDQQGVSLKWGTRYQQTAGTTVSKSNLQKGDLVFFGTNSKSTINHVGIYIGNGQFIHNKPSTNGVAIDKLNSGYWSDHYIKAQRVL